MMKLKSLISIIAIIILLLVPISTILMILSKENLIEFETLSKGRYSGHEEKVFYVINSDDEFLNLWNITYSIWSPYPEPPSIDFTKATIIAVYTGWQGSGTTIEIVKIVNHKKEIHVYYRIEHYVTMVISNPYHIVKTANLTKEVVFTEI